MFKHGLSRKRITQVLLALTSLGLVSSLLPALATTEITLWTFTGGKNDGEFPAASLLRDKAGNLYGATLEGGASVGPGNIHGDGTVFKVTPPATAGGAWTESLLWSFGVGGSSSDGTSPMGNLIMDGNGNLYGTTVGGGPTSKGLAGLGTVFELLPPGVAGGNWTEAILHTFTGGRDGSGPLTGLTIDKKGDLYGTTPAGGAYQSGSSGGIVFELSPPATAGGAWTKKTLWNFGAGTDGAAPSSSLLRDAVGNLYGTTDGGGIYGGGIVFELIKPTTAGGSWTESILWNFGNGTDGGRPHGTLVMDKNGNLYGTASEGGSFLGGTAFELSPPTVSGGDWNETILWDFGNGSDGVGPDAGMIMDPRGILYGTTESNPTLTAGTVFKLRPPAVSGGAWTESILESLPSPVLAGVIMDPQGHLYGVTYGTVYELTNIGG